MKSDFLQRLCWRNPQVTLSTLTPAPRILLCQGNSTFSLMFFSFTMDYVWVETINHHISWYKYFVDFDFERKWTSEKAISSWYRCHYHCSPQSLYNMPESQRQLKTSKVVRVHLAQLLGLDDWVSAPQDPPGSSTASTTASPRARPTTPHPSQDLLQLLISFPNLPSDQFRSQI